ncbi:MAG TPA: hypothetical protein VMS65_12785 [Polyangiaceae bacterium]|nr:hypothetical protein [Polyangiaceae bacterium]
MRRRVAVVLAVLAFGCAGDPEPIPCNEAAECPVVDEAADDGDVRVLWGEGQKLVLSLDEEPSDIEVVGGEVVFTPDPDDLDCEGPCAITLKRLRIRLKDLYFVSSEDSVKVAGLELAFKAPLELGNPDGVVSIVPVESETLTCATVQGLLWAHQTTLSEANVLVARATNEALTFDVSAAMPLDGSTVLGCRPFDLKLTGTLTGVTPFDQNPTATE